MSSLTDVQSWMRWWGWGYTEGAMLKRDASGVVIAHRGDAVWEADLDKADAMIDRQRALAIGGETAAGGSDA